VIDLGPQVRKRGRTVKRRGSASGTHGGLAMHSAANADWGTPMLLRRLVQAVLRPAAKMGGSIDIDYSTSAYWQRGGLTAIAPAPILTAAQGEMSLLPRIARLCVPRYIEVRGF
jgi:hypothetical protein